MSILSTFFTSSADKLVDSISNGIDKIFTSDEERLILKNEIQKEINTFKKDMENISIQYESEITKRWSSDNEHFITRLTRPLSYIFTLTLFAIMVLCDGNIGQFTINSTYIPVIQTLLATMTVALFGSRGIEKSIKHFKKG